jgi:hypothetical protein
MDEMRNSLLGTCRPDQIANLQVLSQLWMMEELHMIPWRRDVARTDHPRNDDERLASRTTQDPTSRNL